MNEKVLCVFVLTLQHGVERRPTMTYDSCPLLVRCDEHNTLSTFTCTSHCDYTAIKAINTLFQMSCIHLGAIEINVCKRLNLSMSPLHAMG